MPDWAGIGEGLRREAGIVTRGDARPVAGGCINAGWRLETTAGPVFVKTHRAGRRDMLEAEREGLVALAGADGPRVPVPLASGVAGDTAWLAMEWMETGRATAATGRRLGEALARMHGSTADAFGWHRDNTIGSTPQPNPRTGDWPDFFARHRLGHQLALAAGQGANGALAEEGSRLLEGVPALLAGHAPVPSLLHGDLWGGNWAAGADGTPWVFDPAVYHGDREADLAMTRLFGGFGPEFYEAYRAAWPLAPGAGVRADLYNLYHVLNHLNLFGGGYRAQALGLIRRLLGELG